MRDSNYESEKQTRKCFVLLANAVYVKSSEFFLKIQYHWSISLNLRCVTR